MFSLNTTTTSVLAFAAIGGLAMLRANRKIKKAEKQGNDPNALSEHELDLITATVPLLEAHGEVLAKRFYEIMFEDPEHTKMFNKTNFANGRQVAAIAKAVLAYAKNIRRVEVLLPFVKFVAAKHCSLNILPEHYPRVGACLLQAIKEICGDAATPEIVTAWGKAYGQLAAIFISVEEGVYKANAAKEGGWRNQREFILSKKVMESEEVASFYWRPADGKPIAPYLPGQYTGLCVQIQGRPYYRNYTLSQSFQENSNTNEYRTSVKLEPNGLVSSHLHNMKVGDCVLLTAPVGDFVLSGDSERNLVLIAGGVGITPMIPIIETALNHSSRSSVTLIYAARSKNVQPFTQFLQELKAKCAQASGDDDRFKIHHFYSQEDRRLTLKDLRRLMPVNPDVYYTGPVAFMEDVKAHLKELNVPANQCFCEFFGPAKDI